MTKKNKIKQHSANNNCLSADTINDFLTGKLNARELKFVLKHISECEFCADAIEGYKNVHMKDTLLNTVKQINNKINLRSSQGIYRFLSVNKRMIAYSSLAASVLIIVGLFFLINNPKIQNNNIVSDNQILKESKQTLPQGQEQNKEKGPLVTYDSFPVLADKRIKTLPKEKILSITGKSTLESYDKSDLKEPVKQEETTDIPETEVSKGTEKVKSDNTKLTEVPPARAAEISSPPAYYSTGTGRKKSGLARKEYSQPQEILATQMQSDEDILDEKEPVPIIDEFPRFENDGLEHFKEYIQKNLQYPRRAKELMIEGEVSVKFTVDTTGRVINTEVLNSADTLLNKEALRVVNSSPVWTPGKQDGVPVNVTYVVPVIFKID